MYEREECKQDGFINDFEQLNIFKFINNDALKVQVKTIIKNVYPFLNAINGEFKEYTMHDIGHAFRVASYMDKLALGITDKSIELNKSKFSDFDFVLMILSAVLHDIGMYYNDEDKNEIINGNEVYFNKFTFKGVRNVLRQKNPNTTDNDVVHEIIRRLHHRRVVNFIDKNGVGDLMKLEYEFPYKDVVSKICIAHGENFSYLKELPCNDIYGDYRFDSRYIATILRIADLLDIDGQRTPMLWYRINKPEGFSKAEWEKHFIISNNEKLFPSEDKMKIAFYGKSQSPKIHRLFLRYLDDLRKEISNANDLIEEDRFHDLNILTKIDNNVETVGFDYVDLKLNLDYNSITELLMGGNIYQDKKLGLRELIQNSIDACKLREEKEVNNIIEPYQPKIIIEISKNNNYVRLIDNGTGMDFNIIKNYFLNVGISYYTSEEFQDKDLKYKPIGKFGIGFLACYLLSKKVTVKSKYYLGADKIQIELEKGSEYIVTKKDNEASSSIGTEIEMSYIDFFDVFNDIESLRTFVASYFFTDIPILIVDSDRESEKKIEYERDVDKLRQVKFKNLNGEFIENIICEKYDDELKGNILIKYKGFDCVEEKYESSEDVYLYDKANKKFFETKFSDLLNGQYTKFKYPIFNNDELVELKSKIKNHKNKSKIYITFARKNNSLKTFFVPEDVLLAFNDFEEVFEIDDITLPIILNNSGINSVENSFDDTCYPYKIFKNGLKSLKLFSLRFSRYYNEDASDNYKIYSLFYRDIYVENLFFRILNPFNFKIIGCCINNLDLSNRLVMNVARQAFLKRKHYLDKIKIVLLKHFRDIESNSDILKVFLDLKIGQLEADL